jgi:alpha-amylase
VALDLPKAVNGLGYVAYAPAGQTGSFSAPALATTQEYDGAGDLDIHPADGTLTQICRVDAVRLKTITAALSYDTTSWTKNTSIALEIDGPTGIKLAAKTYTAATAQGSTIAYTPSVTGWYSFKIKASLTPSANPKPAFALRTTYTAPQQ